MSSINKINYLRKLAPLYKFRGSLALRLFSDNEGSECCTPLPPSCTGDVPGLSCAVVSCPSEPVGPDVDTNKCGPYKVPEYFCYNKDSYFEAEVEMLQYRMPQPSAERK